MNSLKIAILLIVGVFFVSACVSFNKPLKRTKSVQKTTISVPQNALRNFTDELNFTLLKANFAKKDAHIRIFGDSHMAADFFSSRLRTHIKTNSIGFAYPLQPKYHQVVPLQYKSKNFELLNSKSNADSNNGEKDDFPMGGIIAKSAKAGAFINLDSTKDEEFSFGILFQSPNATDALIITDKRGKILRLKSSQINKWSYATLPNLRFPISISAVDKGVLVGGYFIISDKGGKIIDTLGINGAKSDLWLRWDKALFLQELNLLKSDIVVLAYGSNDALVGDFDEEKFKEHYKNFIQMLYASNPSTSIILIAPPTITQKTKSGEYELASDFERVRKAIYELAKEEKLVLFDMHQFMQNSGGKALWVEQNLSREDVHLSPEGYKLMADEFYQALSKML